MLKATLKHVPLLAGYLHDAEFSVSDLVLDRERKTLALTLLRVCYEKPEKGRFLWVLPVIRHPWMKSRLTLTGVQSVAQQDLRGASQGEPCMLLDIVQPAMTTLELQATTALIRAEVSSDTGILIEDLGEPREGTRVIDFRRPAFTAMQEIEALRQDG